MNEKPTKEELERLAVELEHLAGMERTQGWKLVKEASEARIASLLKFLAVCSKDQLEKAQGELAAIRWVLGYTASVAQELDDLSKEVKDETT